MANIKNTTIKILNVK